MIGSFDDFDFEKRQNFGESVRENRPLIGAIGKQLLEAWKQTFHRDQQREAAIAVLNACGMNVGSKQQTRRIYGYMALLALDLLARLGNTRSDRYCVLI